MRDAIVHFCWLVTHFIRSFTEQYRVDHVLVNLGEEVKVLQVELHRAHRLIEGYNLVVERSERSHFYQLKVNQFVFLIVVILVGVLVCAYYRTQVRQVAVKALPIVTGDTGGSSDSEESHLGQTPLDQDRAVGRKGVSIVRPSSVGRGRGKAGWRTS